MGRMKEVFQEYQQLREDAIEQMEESGYSREAAETYLDGVLQCFPNACKLLNSHKEDN